MEICQKIKNKVENIHLNPLEHLNKIQFGTKKNPNMQLETLNDFPILSLEEMQDDIFFGSYYLRQSKSYFSDMHRIGTYCNITLTVLNSYKSISPKVLDILTRRLNSHKIIGLMVTSRHMRSLKSKRKKDNLNDEITSGEEEEEEEEIETNPNRSKEIRRLRYKYKVFIEYHKDSNSSHAIKSIVIKSFSSMTPLYFFLF